MTVREDTAKSFAEYGYEDLTPSQRADMARNHTDVLRLALGLAGWNQVRPDRWEEHPAELLGAVIETHYVYGETTVKLWANRRSVEPVDVFRFIGQESDRAEMDRLNRFIHPAQERTRKAAKV